MVGKKWKLRNVRRRYAVLTVAVGVVIVVAAAGLITWGVLRDSRTGIDSAKFQAVFLTNGQVYFGKLEAYTPQSMKLTDIFYLQAKDAANNQTPQQLANSTADVQLIKLGNEVYGPADEMIIPKTQVLYYENLKSDGNVAQTMQKYNAAH